MTDTTEDLENIKTLFLSGNMERADAIEILMNDHDMSEEDSIALIDSWMEELDDAP